MTFSLGGLSKSAGLPHLKLGWIVVSAPEHQVDSALERLEVIADAYLSVSTPVQVAAGRLIECGRTIAGTIAARLQRNLGSLEQRLQSAPGITLLELPVMDEDGRMPRLGSHAKLQLRHHQAFDVVVAREEEKIPQRGRRPLAEGE